MHDLGLLTYPERVGIDPDRLREGGYSDEDVWMMGPFLQSWLWIGLLGEALGVGVRGDRDQRITSKASFIVERTSGHPRLDTSKLDHFIRVASGRAHAPIFQIYFIDRLARCIQTATMTIERISDIQLPQLATSDSKDIETGDSLLLICLLVQILTATILRYSKRLVLHPHLLLSMVSAPKMLPATRRADHLLTRAG